TIGTAWLITRRFATAYIEPVLMRLTGIDMGPLACSFGGIKRANSWVVSLTIQPCCQPVILVGHELAGRIDARPHVGEMRGAIIVPTVLVPAHELNAHRFSDRLR